MIGDANPGKDRVAFASAATTGFRRDSGEVTPASLALEACITAIKDAGVAADDINGLVGANPQYIQSVAGHPAPHVLERRRASRSSPRSRTR